MTAPKRFPDRDEIAAVRAETKPLENGGAADSPRRIAGRAILGHKKGETVEVQTPRGATIKYKIMEIKAA